MQRPGCEQVQFLLSKYADGEATPEERERIDHHAAGCEACACKLLEYGEMAAIFSETAFRSPEPDLRAGLFREIGKLKEVERRKARAASQEKQERGWRSLPLPSLLRTASKPKSPLAAWAWRVAGPFAVAGVAVFGLTLMLFLASKSSTNVGPDQVSELTDRSPLPMVVPTNPPPIAVEIPAKGNAPSPVGTKVMAVYPLTTSSSATVRASTAPLRDMVLQLQQPTPILEGDDLGKASAWHVVRDAAHGYTVSYPPNWWTQFHSNTRSFYPWGPGGTRYTPYWIEISVADNIQGWTAETFTPSSATDSCEPVATTQGMAARLRCRSSDESNEYDELYSFDARQYYVLRANVPKWSQAGLGALEERWSQAQNVFSRMARQFSIPSEPSQSSSAHNRIFFLNGTDLWSVGVDGNALSRVTRGYKVLGFALSPDMRRMAFAATAISEPDGSDPSAKGIYAKGIYIVGVDGDASTAPSLLWSTLAVHDLAWYDNRTLAAIARSEAEGLGIYRLSVGEGDSYTTVDIESAPEPSAQLLRALDDTMSGARGLAVSPDRQLLTFLAPLGGNMGTDVYVLRPDGSDLQPFVSHADPAMPATGSSRVEWRGQAIKSYIWTEGRLESKGYKFGMLFTCGDYYSPNFNRGGFLYSAPGATFGPLIQPGQLGVPDPFRVEIVHLAYTTAGSLGPNVAGKLAITGYYVDYNNRADQLAGLWTADVVAGTFAISNLRSQPIPGNNHGVADLQWSPDGKSLIYRETMQDLSQSSRYDGNSPFLLVKLNPETGSNETSSETLYNGNK